MVGCGSELPRPHPADSLATLDARTPVPLLPPMALHQKQNMQDHLLVVQQITDGLAREDWAAVEAAASRIASSPQMQLQCEHMGMGADGFTERALDFHRRADGIVAAAKEQDAAKVLASTAATLEACTSCHSTYRQEVVSDAVWAERTGSAVPVPHG
jgi:hypothetical protein